MNTRRTLAVFALAATAVVLGACGSSTDGGSSGTTTSPPPPPPEGDKEPPTISAISSPAPYSLVYFDTLAIGFQVYDAGGLQLVTAQRVVFANAPNANVVDSIRLNGAVTSTQIVRFPGPQMDLHPQAAQITIHAVDLSGNARDSTFWVTFAAPPSIAGNVLYNGQLTVLVPSDTVELQVSASSATPLTWLGYRIGAPVNLMDSVSVTGTSARHDFSFVLTRDWNNVGITYFAHNALGDFVNGITSVTVLDAVRKPTTRVPLSASVGDVAFDVKRNVLYLSQPDSNRILVFSLTTKSFVSPITFGSAPTGLDLSLGGDSLFVALRRGAAIGIIDLSSGAQSRVPVQVDPEIGEGPEFLRMSANGLGIVTMASDGHAITPSGIFEFDPAYQTVLPRTEPGSMAANTTGATIVRSVDRQKVLVALAWPASDLYDAASNSFTTTNHGAMSSLSTTAHGDRFLYGPMLYDGSLNLIRQVASPIGGPTVLSADGLTAYFGNDYGYQAFRTADDGLVQRVVGGPFTGRLLLTPSGDRLISVNPSELVIVDLN